MKDKDTKLLEEVYEDIVPIPGKEYEDIIPTPKGNPVEKDCDVNVDDIKDVLYEYINMASDVCTFEDLEGFISNLSSDLEIIGKNL